MMVSPTMAQEAMDTFLKSLGATDNPFTVEDLFDASTMISSGRPTTRRAVRRQLTSYFCAFRVSK